MKIKAAFLVTAAVFILTGNFVWGAEGESETVEYTSDLNLIPSEERIPKAEAPAISPENLIPPIKHTPSPLEQKQPAPVAAYRPPDDFSPFQVPLIRSMERGKWYVQIGAYSRAEHVEDEISRIGTAYPIVIQNVGSDIKPTFRILLGPLNQGESGAVLQRVKSIGYKGAFVRHNP
jgi:cell division septation protein DedD